MVLKSFFLLCLGGGPVGPGRNSFGGGRGGSHHGSSERVDRDRRFGGGHGHGHGHDGMDGGPLNKKLKVFNSLNPEVRQAFNSVLRCTFSKLKLY